MRKQYKVSRKVLGSVGLAIGLSTVLYGCSSGQKHKLQNQKSQSAFTDIEYSSESPQDAPVYDVYEYAEEETMSNDAPDAERKASETSADTDQSGRGDTHDYSIVEPAETEEVSSIIEIQEADYHDVFLPERYFYDDQEEVMPEITEEDVDQAIWNMLSEELEEYEEDETEASMIKDVNEISQLTDEIVRENTDYDSMQTLREEVRKTLEIKEKHHQEMRIRQELLGRLVEESQASVSEEEIRNRVNEMIKSEEAVAAFFARSYEEYVKEETGLTVEEYNANLYDTARMELERRKIIEAFAAKEQIDLSAAAWQLFLTEEAVYYGYESAEDYLSEMQQIGLEKYLKNLFLETQTAYHLQALSKEQANH